MKKRTILVGTLTAAALSFGGLTSCSSEGDGKEVREDATEQSDDADKDADAKCGEGKDADAKCGEGKCGEGKDSTEAKCGEGKDSEATCGEDKADEASCGEDKADDATCGEDKDAE